VPLRRAICLVEPAIECRLATLGEGGRGCETLDCGVVDRSEALRYTDEVEGSPGNRE